MLHFFFFHTRSTAAASIGQVHRAETLDGSQIAVKVQYLGLADIQKVLSLVSMMKMLWLILDMTQMLERMIYYLNTVSRLPRPVSIMISSILLAGLGMASIGFGGRLDDCGQNHWRWYVRIKLLGRLNGWTLTPAPSSLAQLEAPSGWSRSCPRILLSSPRTPEQTSKGDQLNRED